jgi:bifunctional non-homologous end joining protein LigD
MQESVSLRFKNGSSDKVYNAELKPSGDGWLVEFAYGRYGGTLTPGSKTPAPIALDKAKKIYDKLVSSKTSKGYSPDGEGVAFAGTADAGRVTGMQPQLLNDVSVSDILDAVRRSPGSWGMQVKFDGERRPVAIRDGQIVGANRRGLEVPLRQDFVDAIDKIVAAGLRDFEIDTEDMGGFLVAFDMTSYAGEDVRGMSAETRLKKLATFEDYCILAKVTDVIRVAETWVLTSTDQLTALINEMDEKKDEGVVFKKLDAPYSAGRPSSGGDQLKLKFWKDITVRVSHQNDDKRSVGMEILKDGDWTGVGNITIPPNQDIPEAGDLIDVKYLYAYDGGSLFQPIFRRLRTDYLEEECTTDKLFYKPEAPQ